MVGAKFQRLLCIVMIPIPVLALASLNVRNKSLPHFDACGGAMNSQPGKSRLWPTIPPLASYIAATLLYRQNTIADVLSYYGVTLLPYYHVHCTLLLGPSAQNQTPHQHAVLAFSKGQGLGCKEEAAVTYQDTTTKGDV